MYLVYIREAHPTDGWQVGSNRRDGILFEQPKTFAERVDVAAKMCEKLEIDLPCLIDNINNKVGADYAAWPDRIYVIGTDGRIIYKSGPGPRGFRPDEAGKALAGYLRNRIPETP